MISLQKAYLGMQCFWGAESTFAKLDGVLATRVGYAGGTTATPNYRNIGDHTEITEVQFDERIISYDKILDCFWENHDPTKEKYGKRKLRTYIQKLIQFYQAEDYHQKYWLRCQTAIFEKLNLNDEEVVSSLLATKVNAFLGGYKNFDVLKQLADKYRLDDDVIQLIESIAVKSGDTSACHFVNLIAQSLRGVDLISVCLIRWSERRCGVDWLAREAMRWDDSCGKDGWTVGLS
ncbi:unnamed protein product [Cercopithifilaria johnstoni]|uniref:peptide-methionine (S)-S-oxide reductase n=1 Tax=Cercopithifilaria johnstoni TaxID=2874296 RepID=A0A8J2Q0D6_9BILA|nr:unnamed protein product [Cercopithifilaria johnstoni]